MSQNTSLYYVYDPMCSWCWGYQPKLKMLEATLQQHDVPWKKVLGGLAPDTDEPMPIEMQSAIQSYWRKIHGLLGTTFNHDFWLLNTPRRATYPACRAILIARQHGMEDEMNNAIQEAYYLHAKNPSDNAILSQLAADIGLNSSEFSHALESINTQITLEQEVTFARSIGGNSFPSWIIKTGEHCTSLPIDYKDPRTVIDAVREAFCIKSN